MYIAVSKLQKRLLAKCSDMWTQEDFETRLTDLDDWNALRELECIYLDRKAKLFKFIIDISLIWSALAGTLMITMILFSNGSQGYYLAMLSFEIQMLIMLMLHLVFKFWRWLWRKKLDKLALAIPIDYM